MITIIVILFIALCLLALLKEDFPGLFQHRNQNHNGSRRGNNRYTNNNKAIHVRDVYCPECGSPNVTVYQNGDCVCQDCEFQFNVDYL